MEAPWPRPLVRAVVVGFLVLTVALAGLAWLEIALRWSELGSFPGSDIRFYLDASGRWLHGGAFYEPYELAGPFVLSSQDVLYPPTTLIILVPFLVLPLALWWIVPLGITVWIIVSHRPSMFAWGVISVALWVPNTIALIIAGNPVIWGLMTVALAVRYGWPGAFLLLKPTVAPLALLWARRRSWWLALAAVSLASAPFLPLWFDYVTVLRNARDPRVGSLLHSLGDLPLLSIPIVARLGQTSSPSPVR